MSTNIQDDLTAIGRIDAVNMILKTLRGITDMRISLVARIDEDSWTACAVNDEADFGLQIGDNLDLSTTY